MNLNGRTISEEFGMQISEHTLLLNCCIHTFPFFLSWCSFFGFYLFSNFFNGMLRFRRWLYFRIQARKASNLSDVLDGAICYFIQWHSASLKKLDGGQSKKKWRLRQWVIYGHQSPIDLNFLPCFIRTWQNELQLYRVAVAVCVKHRYSRFVLLMAAHAGLPLQTEWLVLKSGCMLHVSCLLCVTVHCDWSTIQGTWCNSYLRFLT
jgi:hypothetical protein